MNQSIVACGNKIDIGIPVVLWGEKEGLVCPNKRGRTNCQQHDPILNDQPTRPEFSYKIFDLEQAYEELKKSVHQLILHYDVCYCSYQCHRMMQDSPFKGSHFYLDLDGMLYQTCDLYWKTNTAPADDKMGNERSVHVEMSNLSWEALEKESEFYQVTRDQYRRRRDRWMLHLPREYQDKIRTRGFKPYAARSFGKRGYFSRKINGKTIRMWDFTEEQYRVLIRLCLGINRLLPKIRPQVPHDNNTGKTPLGKIRGFSSFCGILGHAHVQGGTSDGIDRKYDPGPAFNWSRLRKEFLKEKKFREKNR